MRTWTLGAVCLLLACNSSGSQVGSGADASTDATAGDAAGDAVADASEEPEGAESAPPCLPLTGTPLPSDDCVYAGACPSACGMGTQSAYACQSTSVLFPDSGVYPSAFEVPVGIVTVVGYESSGYPWDASAWVSCGPLTCVRWSTADHLEGGSVWPTDPCGASDAGPLAWVCPPFAGVFPATDAGCANAGDVNAIGGQDSGVPRQNVWCCGGSLPSMPGDAGTDGSAGEGGASDSGSD